MNYGILIVALAPMELPQQEMGGVAFRVYRKGFPTSYRLIDKETGISVTGLKVFFSIEQVQDWLGELTN